jgi:cytochrome c peroxidase
MRAQRSRTSAACVFVVLTGFLGGCARSSGFDWKLPSGFPEPLVPADNPMTEAKVELGRRLFYDARLSLNQSQSCASCHKQELAFTDGRARGLGSTGELHPRGPMSLVNIAYGSMLTWGNPLIQRLEEQALLPLFGETPVELGLSGNEDVLLDRLRGDTRTAMRFREAFPGESEPVTVANVTRALAAFERSIISGRSAYDRFNAGDDSALSASAKRGLTLFFGERLECFHCHGGFTFADATMHSGKKFTEIIFHNTGLYNIGGTGAYPNGNTGIHEITHRDEDMGKFKAPTLRNIELTAPYMHDGSIATLDEVLDHYAAGGRTIPEGPYAGVGSASPYKSGFLHGFTLTADERADILAFLRSLTDLDLLSDPRFGPPLD